MKTSKDISIGYFLFGIFAIGSGVLSGIYGHSFIHLNYEAADIIVTFFSIMVGFLIAVMSILGSSSLVPGWKKMEASRDEIKSKLIRHKWLFYLYLITLTLIFIETLTRNLNPQLSALIERIYFGAAISAFIFSFKLPSILMGERMASIDESIETARKQAPKIEE